MTSKSLPNPSVGSSADKVKYVLAALLMLGGAVVYTWFENTLSGVIRVLVVVAGLVLGLGLLLTTAFGQRAREYLSESSFEFRKVVWPTRQEATRTMWIVVIAVVMISLILAAIDWLIQLSVQALLGS